MKRLTRECLPSLQVYYVDMSREVVPFDYQILEEAKGASLAALQMDMGVSSEILFNLGVVVARLHSVTTEGFGMLDVKQILSDERGKGLLAKWTDYILLRLDTHVGFLFDAGIVSLEDGAVIERAFEQTLHRLEWSAPSLLHGDLGGQNIFSDGRCITALIDWEDCLSGDPVFDIASWGTFIGNRDRRATFLEGYRTVRELPEDFELRYWLYYLRVVLAKTVHRYRFGYHCGDRIPASGRVQEAIGEVRRLVSSGAL
jgi:Ser/Thr protein kinase RdoA (MazF antagonist)